MEENKVVRKITKDIYTPAGNKFTIRRIKLSDEDILTDSELARRGDSLPVFIENITGMSRKTYDALLQGEIFYLLIQIRIFSKGRFYETKVKSPYSGKLIPITIDLEKDLRYQKLDKSLLDENYEFKLKLPFSGDEVTGRLLQGADQHQIEYIKKEYSDKLMTAMMMLKTKSVNGKEVNIDYFLDMDAEDSEFLRNEYEARDCGYDTEIIVYDRMENGEFSVNLPFDESFFLGKKRERKKKAFR